MKFDKIDPNGKTNRELLEALAHGQNLAHDCYHRLEGKVEIISDAVGDLRKDVGGLQRDSATIDALRVRLGVVMDTDGNIKAVKPAVGAWPMWKIATTFFGALSGIVLFVQLMLPAIVAGSVAFYHALMAAPR